MPRKSLLLHVCCAPCAMKAVKRISLDYEVVLFFSNSNIWPEEEYLRRLDMAKKFAKAARLSLAADRYDHQAWRDMVRGFEAMPEGGRRCKLRFYFSLERAALYARDKGLGLFTTTLSASRHKDTKAIFRVMRSLSHLSTPLLADLKKDPCPCKCLDRQKAGLLKNLKGLEVYRQDYCGCEFSVGRRPRPVAVPRDASQE